MQVRLIWFTADFSANKPLQWVSADRQEITTVFDESLSVVFKIIEALMAMAIS